MNRPILSNDNGHAIDSSAPATPEPQVTPPEATTIADASHQATRESLVIPHRDVLAGALPEWDLVPQTQFVKRVKRAES
jgi:hypothetical protein